MEVGHIVFLAIAFALLVLILLVFRSVIQGGPPTSKDSYRPYDFALSSIPGTTCSARVVPKKQQCAFLGNQMQSCLPPDTIPLWFKGGMQQSAPINTIVGQSKGTLYFYEKGVQKTKDVEAVKGTAVDCCRLLQQTNSMTPAVFNPTDQTCSIFPNLSVTADDTQLKPYMNLWPISDPEIKDVKDIPTPTDEEVVFMVGCGGMGQLPCDYHSGIVTPKDMFDPRGCTTAYAKDTPSVKGLHLYRSFGPKGNNGYPDMQYVAQCQIKPWIKFHARYPDANGVWQDPDGKLPNFNYKNELHTPWDPNNSEAWFDRT